MKAKTFSTTINGDRWRYRLLDPDRFKKLHTDENTAITDFEKKLIDFRADALTLGPVIHEVSHAYLHYLFLGSTTELSVRDYEEIVCEMLEQRIFKIIEQAQMMHTKMSAHLASKESTPA